MALTAKQRRFVDEYLIDLNATQAAIRAGYSAKNADKIGPELLGKTRVQECLAERMQEREERTEITQDMVLKRWWEIANVDVNQLVEYRRENCRHCWGIDHAYQWTESEFELAQKEAVGDEDDLPDCSGGFGFIAGREPNPDCPQCGGEGRGKVFVHDSRKLKGAALRVYNGVQMGKDGLKVLILDRDKALENVARHLGMFKDRVEHSGPNGGPIPVKSSTSEALKNLTDEQIAQLEAIATAAAVGSGGDKG